jgi:hypothetical protein
VKTRWLAAERNLSALAYLSGKWIDRVHGRRPPKGILLEIVYPDNVARIRLSDKISRLHPRWAAAELGQAYEPEVPV